MSLESPFLDSELAVEPSSVGQSDYSLKVLAESPFLQGFAEDFVNFASTLEQSDVDEFSPEEAQEFPESDDAETDEEWSDVEYDVPPASASDSVDSLLAVPAFTDAQRTSIGNLLTPARSKAAMRWNAENHARKSGVAPERLLVALQSYVDVSAVNDAIAGYNAQHPNAPINLGTKPVDATFVEALHQFQMKCYKDAKQHDGLAGASVLDSLGFWPRKGLLSSTQTNEWAKSRVRSKRKEIEAALSISTDLTRGLTQSNWWSSFVNPCFLGWGFVHPIHIYFARKLRKAELWLLSQSRFAGKTPAEMAALLHINEKHAGGRSKADSKSIHTLGLAIDIKYLGNPHVGDYRDKPRGAKRFSEVMKRAAAKISGFNLTEEKFPQYLNKLGTDTSQTTGQIYDELVRRDQDLRQYLALREAREDLAALRIGVFMGRQARDPLQGFLNLDRDLVMALRDHACLVWGAVDFGSDANGDIMHFDCRLDEVGRAVYCGTGGTFNGKHPCWKHSDPPCPQATARPRRTRARAGEVEDSECEDGYLAEDDYLAAQDEETEEQFAEHLAAEDDKFTDQFDETEESEEFNDYSYETGADGEELLETATPPLLKNSAGSHSPDRFFSDREDEFPGDEFAGVEESDSDREEMEEQPSRPPNGMAVSLMRDNFQTMIGEEEVIGLDSGANLNIQLAVSASDATARTYVDVELVIRTPGKPKEKIVARVLKVPKKGIDPNNPGRVFYQLSVPTTDLNKIVSPLDRVKEVATVRRIGGTSDARLIRALGVEWQVRGQAEQAGKCGISSGSFADERPDALKLFQAGGVAMLELRDSSNAVRLKRFIRNPADVFYYTGHGLGIGFSRRESAATPMNCLAIEEHVSSHDYCCWLSPGDLTPHWKSPMDLDVLIIAGCSVLAVDSSTGSISGDGLAWAKLLKVSGGPLLSLLGYGDWDDNEDRGQGPMGATAPLDKGGGDAIASEMGKWMKSNPKLNGIIRKWLTINMSHQNPFGVGFDQAGYCWRTRRKRTAGWKTEEKLITKDRIHYVIEKLKVI